MSNVVVYMSMPVDGFIAGPSDDLELRRRAGVGRPSVGRSRVERLARRGAPLLGAISSIREHP